MKSKARLSRLGWFARFALAASAAGVALGVPAVAHAGGYDTPMLYSARHMGMGGAAIGYVNDPSALFHNPAGLAQIDHGEVLGDFSLVLGKIHASPGGLSQGKNIDSDLTVAPFFLVGGAYRVQKYVTLGIGLYPIASAGATFHYPTVGSTTPNFEDRTELFFLEASPAIAVNPLPNLRFGLGYRITYVRLVRFAGAPDQSPSIDFTVTGQNFTGFRAGAQWDALPWLQFGAVYRNKVTTKVSNTHGIAFNPYTDISTKFTLPSKVGVGTRADFEQFGLHGAVAVDFEYTFNSENKGDPLLGTPEPGATDVPTSVNNIFNWSDSQTLRIGAEYRILRDQAAHLDHVPLRVGWVHDTKTANEHDPTAFGTPPGPTNVLTLGTGYNGGLWQTNLAYAYRFGTGVVPKAGLDQNCAFCSHEGDYSIHLSGIYVDGSYKF